MALVRALRDVALTQQHVGHSGASVAVDYPRGLRQSVQCARRMCRGIEREWCSFGLNPQMWDGRARFRSREMVRESL